MEKGCKEGLKKITQIALPKVKVIRNSKKMKIIAGANGLQKLDPYTVPNC